MADGTVGPQPITLEVEFALDNLAGTTSADMNIAMPGTVVAHTTWRAPRAGSWRGVRLVANAARTAGTVTPRYTVSGTPAGTNPGALIDATNTREYTWFQPPNVDRFAAGDLLGIELQSSGYTPAASVDFSAWLIVDLDP